MKKILLFAFILICNFAQGQQVKRRGHGANIYLKPVEVYNPSTSKDHIFELDVRGKNSGNHKPLFRLCKVLWYGQRWNNLDGKIDSEFNLHNQIDIPDNWIELYFYAFRNEKVPQIGGHTCTHQRKDGPEIKIFKRIDLTSLKYGQWVDFVLFDYKRQPNWKVAAADPQNDENHKVGQAFYNLHYRVLHTLPTDSSAVRLDIKSVNDDISKPACFTSGKVLEFKADLNNDKYIIHNVSRNNGATYLLEYQINNGGWNRVVDRLLDHRVPISIDINEFINIEKELEKTGNELGNRDINFRIKLKYGNKYEGDYRYYKNKVSVSWPGKPKTDLHSDLKFNKEKYSSQNDFFKIDHAKCKGSNSGKLTLKKVKAAHNFYINIRKLVQNDTINSFSAYLPADSIPWRIPHGFSSGNYEIQIINSDKRNNQQSDGCAFTDTFSIKEPEALQLTYNLKEYKGKNRKGEVHNVSCHDASDGILTVKANGGLALMRSATHQFQDYEYILYEDGHKKTSQVDTKGVFKGLSPDHTYKVVVRDRFGCESVKDNIKLTKPDKLEPRASKAVLKNYYGYDNSFNITCHGSSDTVRVFMKGGAPPYRCRIGGQMTTVNDTLSTGVLSGLKVGDHILEVTDANGCIYTEDFNLKEPTAITVDPVVLEEPLCFSTTGGKISITAEGGVPLVKNTHLYTFKIRHQNADNLKNVYEGRFSETLVISKTEKGIFKDLLSGTYDIFIEDFYGCDVGEPTTIVVGQPDRLNLSPDLPNFKVVSCINGEDGVAQLDITGGTKPYLIEFSRDGLEYKPLNSAYMIGDDIVRIGHLKAGTYYLRVRDANGCPKNDWKTKQFDIIQPKYPLELQILSSSDETCATADDGTVSLKAIGGWEDYQYSIDGINYVESSYFSNLSSGIYTFYLRDRAGCTDKVEGIEIKEPTKFVSNFRSFQDLTCFESSDGRIEIDIQGGVLPYHVTAQTDGFNKEYTFNKEGIITIEGLPAGDITLIAKDENGTCEEVFTQTLAQPAQLTLREISTVETKCGSSKGSIYIEAKGGTPPYKYRWENHEGKVYNTTQPFLKNLKASIYNVTVYDQNGCEQTLKVYLNNVEGAKVTLDHKKPVKCHGGSQGSEATIRVDFAVQPYTIVWDDDNKTEGPTIRNVKAGKYVAAIKDGNGCDFFFEVIIEEPAPFEAQASITRPKCPSGNSGSLEVTMSGGNPPYQYSWENRSEKGNVLSNITAGTYILTIKDQNNCSFQKSFVVDDADKIEVPFEDKVVLCEGQTLSLDAGNPGSTYLWSGDHDFKSTEQHVIIDKAGSYNLQLTNVQGCVTNHPIEVQISSDIYKANFLIDSEVYAGDTLIIVDVTKPEPQKIAWKYSKGLVRIRGVQKDFEEVYFPSPGTYEITLEATMSGGCKAYMTRTIQVFESLAKAPARASSDFVRSGSIQNISIIPNPNDGKFNVKVELADISDVNCRVFSLSSNEQIAENSGKGEKSYEIPFDIGTLPDGTYIVLVQTNTSKRIVRFVIKQ